MTKLKRFLIRLEIAAMLLLGVCAVVPAAQTVDASSFHTEVRESIAVVATYLDYQDDGDTDFISSYGTGFFIGEEGEDPEYLITNHHVVSDYLNYGKGEYVDAVRADGSATYAKLKIRVYFDSKNYTEAYVEDYNETKDVALLRLASATDERKPIALCSPTDDMIGSTIYCVGFPGSADNVYVDAISSWSMEDATVTTGTISRYVTTSGTGVKSIQTDAVIQRGNSGGPMVNGNGSVIGIDTYLVDSDGEIQYYAISIDEALSMLNNNNVPYYMEKSSGGISALLENPVVLIGIIAVVVILLLVIIIVVALGGKKKSKVQQAAPQYQQNQQYQQQVPNQQYQQQAAPQYQQQAPNQQFQQQPAPKKRGMIRSLSTQHNGVSIAVDANGILIGRDAAHCKVTFREGTPGVSSRHCSLTYNPDTEEFLLTDLRSTYGTFLTSGQKLEPNVPYHLRAGESFYVGERSNAMRVEVV